MAQITIDRSTDTLPSFDDLLEKLAGVRRAEETARLGTGVINALAGLVALLTTLGILEYLFRFDVGGRTALFWSGAVLGVVILGRSIIPPLGRLFGLLPGEDKEGVARRVGAAIPGIGDRLLNTLQLRPVVAGGSRESSSLARAAISANLPGLLAPDYSVIIDRGERRRSLLLLFSAAVTLAGLGTLLGPELTGAWGRVAEYRTFYQKPAPFTLDVSPGDIEIEPGEPVEVFVTAAGIPPQEISLLLSEDDGEERRISMVEVESGVFRLRLDNLYQNLEYSAEAAGIRSARFRIDVVERPHITSMRVSLAPPRYSGLPVRTLAEGEGHISGLRGTRVTVSAETTVPVSSAEIILTYPTGVAGGPGSFDTVRRPMSIADGRITGGFTLTRNGEYRLVVTSADGKTGRSAGYGIAVTDDRSPSITLLQPALGLDVDESNLIPVQVRIADDFGFSALRIRYRLVASRYDEPWGEPRTVTIPLPNYARRGLEVPFLWDLTPERFMPEDEVEAWVEVYDNDPFLGPKSARTTRFLLRYPGFQEMLDESEQLRDAAGSDLSQLVKNAESARKEMERLNRELAKQLAARQGEAGWEEKRKLQDLMGRHEEMQGKLQDVAEELKNVAERLRQAEAISPETLREYQELQELFEQIENPELRKSMQKLSREMENMSPEEMIEAMKEFEFNEEEFRKAMERTRAALERMKEKEELDRLAATARHLAEEQERLNERMKEELSQDQSKNLAEEQKRLAEESHELQRNASNNRNLDKESAELGRKDPSGRMQNASKDLQQGDTESARTRGEEAAEALQEFARSADEKRERMDRNEGAARLQRMKKSLKELLDLAKEQEGLQSRTSETPSNSPELGQQAREQHGMRERLEQLADRIASPEEPSFKVTPRMAKNLGDAMRQMAEAQSGLEGRKSSQAASSQGKAVSSMAEAAGEMASQIEGMEGEQGEGSGSSGTSGGSGMGEASMRSRIQQLAAQQQMLNHAMGNQGAGQQGEQGSGGERGSGGKNGSDGAGDGRNQQGMSGRLRETQEQIGKSIDELRKEAAASGGRRKSLADDLEEAAQALEAVLNDLADGHVTPETRERQDRILSRLLDALKSSRERDFEQKRESSPGSDLLRPSPSGLPETSATGSDESTMPGDESEQGYSPEYRELIRRYFESLK